MAGRLSAIRTRGLDLVATAQLVVDTQGEGFSNITPEVTRFVKDSQAGEGVLLLFLRHTSASLVIQENADPDVQTDLVSALHMVAPADGPWVHEVEGPDDMPAHIKAMLAGVTLHVPVHDGTMALGVWQGIYLIEHRTQPHRREIVLQFVGARA